MPKGTRLADPVSMSRESQRLVEMHVEDHVEEHVEPLAAPSPGVAWGGFVAGPSGITIPARSEKPQKNPWDFGGSSSGMVGFSSDMNSANDAARKPLIWLGLTLCMEIHMDARHERTARGQGMRIDSTMRVVKQSEQLRSAGFSVAPVPTADPAAPITTWAQLRALNRQAAEGDAAATAAVMRLTPEAKRNLK